MIENKIIEKSNPHIFDECNSKDSSISYKNSNKEKTESKRGWGLENNLKKLHQEIRNLKRDFAQKKIRLRRKN